tara:strand:- start:187 stop:363 length:177 start_codon:yes stop_codon:yes gene_type:complete
MFGLVIKKLNRKKPPNIAIMKTLREFNPISEIARENKYIFFDYPMNCNYMFKLGFFTQ